MLNGSTNNKDARVKDDGYIYMVLEYGEIDLAHMLSQKWKEIDGTNQIIDENWLRFYWQVIPSSPFGSSKAIIARVLTFVIIFISPQHLRTVFLPR